MDVLVTNAINQNGYEQIYPYLTEGKTIALIGSSGVGKSTLINCLLGEKFLDASFGNQLVGVSREEYIRNSIRVFVAGICES
ncbi:MAG: GTPase RsgA [Lachnospiraceae bacterium]|nr:GTPase RsgA [Lachnospiraceae bacterium]